MKKLLLVLCLLALASCAQFSTKQSDISYGTNGLPIRAITTEVKVTDFADSNSSLTKSKALNTDKSQSAELGNLNQSATSSNVVAALALAAQIAASAAK